MLGDPLRLVLAPDHEARDILEEEQGHAALLREFDEMRTLLRAFAEQDAVVGKDRDWHPMDVREAADEAAAVERFEFVEFGGVDEPRDDLVDIVRRANILGNDAVQILRGEGRRARLGDVDVRHGLDRQRRHDVADDRQRMVVILGDVIDHPRFAPMRIRTAQFLGADHLARSRPSPSGGPARKIVPCPRTMIVSSLIAGT